MPRYDYECPLCHKQVELDMTIAEHKTDENNPSCPNHGYLHVMMEKAITKMPLRTYTRRPQDRLWGTSHISSSKKFQKEQRRKNGQKKDTL